MHKLLSVLNIAIIAAISSPGVANAEIDKPLKNFDGWRVGYDSGEVEDNGKYAGCFMSHRWPMSWFRIHYYPPTNDYLAKFADYTLVAGLEAAKIYAFDFLFGNGDRSGSWDQATQQYFSFPTQSYDTSGSSGFAAALR